MPGSRIGQKIEKNQIIESFQNQINETMANLGVRDEDIQMEEELLNNKGLSEQHLKNLLNLFNDIFLEDVPQKNKRSAKEKLNKYFKEQYGLDEKA